MAQPVSGYLYDRNLVRVVASSTVSATANTTGVDVTQFTGNGVTLIFDCSAVVSSGSLAIQVQASDTLGSGYANVTDATATVNASGVTTLFVPNFQGKFLRLAQTLTGTSVTYSCVLYGQPGDATASSGYTNAPLGQSDI